MEVKIFDTHVRTRDGRYLHFDVLVTEELGLAPASSPDAGSPEEA